MSRRNWRRRERRHREVTPLVDQQISSMDDCSVSRLADSLIADLNKLLDMTQIRAQSQMDVSSEIRRLLRTYSRLMQLHQGSESSAPYRDFVLYSLAYVCYTRKVENSNIVSRLLVLIYKNCGNFIVLFQRSFLYQIRDFGWLSDMVTPNEQVDGDRECPFSYFAAHANRAKLRFRGIRFIDLRLTHPNGFRPSPVYLSSSVGEVELLRTLLELGADVGPSEKEMREDDTKPPWVASLITKLLSNAMRNGELQIVANDGVGAPSKEILCIEMLLRAVPYLRVKV